MNSAEQQRFNSLYEQHLTNLKRQGKRLAIIDAYSRVACRISQFFTRRPNALTTVWEGA
jgi:hypothetical protein